MEDTAEELSSSLQEDGGCDLSQTEVVTLWEDERRPEGEGSQSTLRRAENIYHILKIIYVLWKLYATIYIYLSALFDWVPY